VIGLLGLASYQAIDRPPSYAAASTAGIPLPCGNPAVVDGDTLRCGGVRVRLSGIDAPELPGHCRTGRDCAPGDPFASTDNLRRLVGRASLICVQTDTDRYGRAVASCSAEGRDLSCEQLAGGYAIARYGPLVC